MYCTSTPSENSRRPAATAGWWGGAVRLGAVTGVLCFIGADWGWLMRSKQIKGVTVLWPLRLPEHVAAAGVRSELVPAVAARLRAGLKPAT